MTGQVSKPKIYINYIDYFRAAGLVVEVVPTSTNINEDFSDILTYNPSHTKSFTPIVPNDSGKWNLKFKFLLGEGTGESAKLVQSINFGAFLNHNAGTLDYQYITITSLDEGGGGYSLGASGTGTLSNGFRLLSLDDSLWDDTNCFGLQFKLSLNNFTIPFRLGSVIAGRSFSFPHSANLSMNINYDTGIKKSKSIGGFDIVDVNYYRQPDWDGNPPFVSTNASGLSSTSHVGRRSWDLTFSFLKSDNVHPQNMGDGFMFEQTSNLSFLWNNYDTENLISHFMTLTMNGQIPFMFQPDDQVDTFAMCRLRSNSFSVTQSAPNLYTAKMSFDETW